MIIFLIVVLRGFVRYLEESWVVSENCCKFFCSLKKINIVILVLCFFIMFILLVWGICFVIGEYFFLNNVLFVEIELLNLVFYVMEVFWVVVIVILLVCLKSLIDDEILGE